MGGCAMLLVPIEGLLRVRGLHPIYELRVMRGAGPAKPRKGWRPPFSSTATLQLCSNEPIESRAARVR